MLARFRKDPYAVLKYNLANLAILLCLFVLVLVFFAKSELAFSKLWILSIGVFLVFDFHAQLVGSALVFLVFVATGGLEGRLWLLALPIAGAIFGAYSGMLMHNAAHRNVGPRWLNRIVGEACGFHQLGGYMVWTVVHMVHHRYPDDPRLDPHPPGSKSFYAFTRTSFRGLVTCVNHHYREQWTAKDPRYERVWKMTGVVGSSARITRLLLLLFVLGPAGFACFFAPSYAALTLLYWHFNWATHQPNASGEIEIRDLDHNLYYRVANRVLGGFYFHGTHHLRPALFDPYRDRALARPRPRDRARLKDAA